MTSVVRGLPPSRLQAVIDTAGTAERRSRALPAWLASYVVLALALVPGSSYADAVALVWRVAPRRLERNIRAAPPTPGAVSRARLRLGPEPFRLLAEELSSEVLQLVPPVREALLERIVAATTGEPPLPGESGWYLRTAANDLIAVELDDESVDGASRLVGAASPAQVRYRQVIPAARAVMKNGVVLDALRAAMPGVSVVDEGVSVDRRGVGSRDSGLRLQDRHARACIELLLTREVAHVRCGTGECEALSQ